MAHLYGHSSSAGSTTDWHPLATIKDIVGRFLLRISSAGTPKHYNGTADVAAATQAVGATTRKVIVKNAHAGNVLYVSFDGGTTFFSIAAGQVLEIDAEVTSLDVKASVDGTPYEILTLE